MKKILSVVAIVTAIFIFITGCANDNLNYTTLEIAEKVYAGFNEDELPALEKSDMKVLIDNGMFVLENDLGIKELNYDEAIVSQPLIGSIPHSVVVIKLKDTEDVVSVTQEIKNNINPRKWICAEADQVYVENRGNIIIAVMADKTTADKIIENFRNLK